MNWQVLAAVHEDGRSHEEDRLGRVLLWHARGAIAGAFRQDAAGGSAASRDAAAVAGPVGNAGLPRAAGHEHPALGRPGASFVTLTRDGALRGCIGSLEARRSLAADVAANAIAAAFRDPRFPPLALAEFESVRVEVSVLGAAEPMAVASEAEAIDALRPHQDGVILSWAGRRATFLPQVWESLPDAREFLAMLRRKAGLPADFWADDIALSRYRVVKWKEPAGAGSRS